MVKIVIGMPFKDYLAHEGISGSGIKEMLVNPMRYWNYAVNPNAAPDDPTKFMTLGKAYEARIFDGKKGFEEQFIAPPAFANEWEFNGKKLPVVDTVKDIEAVLVQHGIEYKKSWDKANKWAALQAAKFGEYILWDNVLADFQAELDQKCEISRAQYDEVLRNVEILSKAASFAEVYEQPGINQVAVFWKDQETGQECKALIDRVNPNRIMELKTLSNSQDRDFENACIQEMGNRRYNISAAHYIEGWQRVLNAYTDSKIKIEILDQTDRKDVDNLLASFTNQWAFEFLFIQTGDVPFYLIREFSQKWNGKRNGYWYFAEVGRSHALTEIKRFTENFGKEPWLESQIRKPYDDSDFPPWMVL